MRLNKKTVDRLMEERGLSVEDLARLYKGSPGEYSVMCNIKCGFKRAYQMAEIFNCSVDDIMVYSEDKSPRRKSNKQSKRKKGGKNG